MRHELLFVQPDFNRDFDGAPGQGLRSIALALESLGGAVSPVSCPEINSNIKQDSSAVL